MQRKVKLYHYQLPLDCAMIVRGQSVKVREGWIIELHDEMNNKIGRGEIAPLPGFSHETVGQAKQQLEFVIKRWLEQDYIDLTTCFPSVAFGFSTALLELDNGLPKTTGCDNHHYHVDSALLLAADHRLIASKQTQLTTARLCKLKIAANPSVQGACHDGDIARQLLQQYPQLRLRLDANQRWSLVSALAFAHQLPIALRSRIDFIEEPCVTPSECLQFSHETGIAIAWDESLRDADKKKPKLGASELISNSVSDSAASVSYIVIKPMLTGSIAYCRELIYHAQQQGLMVVISSSLESSFGLVQLADIAAWLTPNVIPGLDTIGVFKHQIVTPWPECNLPLFALSELPYHQYINSRNCHDK